MKKYVVLLVFLFLCSFGFGQEVFISGFQQSLIEYTLEQTVDVPAGLHELMISVVEPADFRSQTFQQEVQELSFQFVPQPDKEDQNLDKNNNRIRLYYWDRPQQSIKFQAVMKTNNQVQLRSVQSAAVFPVKNLPRETLIFVEPTDLVQSKHPAIVKKAQELTADARTEMEAVQRIFYFVVDHLRYVLIPEQYDAWYSFQNGKGNCQNYSHLAAALLRAVGIPVRIVNGITFKKAYSVPIDHAEYSFEMAEGRHSWIEVYFTDLDWIPFDPQQTEFFVSNRYLRIEVGRDNDETIQDGLVKWVKSSQGGPEIPRLEESIGSNFLSDEFDLRTEKKITSVKKLLLSPPLQIQPSLLAARDQESDKKAPPPADQVPPEGSKKPVTPSEIDYRKLKYTHPIEFGNLDFPRQFDFLSARLADAKETAQLSELKRNFIVETAEYVTGKQQFSQLFVLDQPIMLKTISLALHHFGGEGFIWIELSDDDQGAPARSAVSSKKITTRLIPPAKGYDWIDFDFSDQNIILTPGKYWLTLNYSGSPIVNWFFSYGKPVGPVDGTRSREFGQSDWGKILNFEFNYRILGLMSQK